MNITTTRPTVAIALPDADDPYGEIAMEGGGQFGKMLKYVKGVWSHKDDEVPIGTQFIAHMPEAMRGDVRFSDSRPVEYRLGYIRDRFRFAPRESLGFTDQSQWERDKKGNPVDPWSPQTYLPMDHCETGELYCFVFRSAGATQTFRDLARAYSPYQNSGKLPIVSLQTDRYNHPDYSWIDVPILKIEDWDDSGTVAPIAPVAEPEIISPPPKAKAADDMDDDIPF
jgi:hypothetical protein